MLLLLLLSRFSRVRLCATHRQQPTRLPRFWDSPGKNTGVGCHFLLQCMKVKSESEVVQSCLTPSDPMDCSLLGSSIHGIFQARVLEWGAIAFSKCWTLGTHKWWRVQMYNENYWDCKAIAASLTHSKDITDAGILAWQSLENAIFRVDLPEQITFLHHC